MILLMRHHGKPVGSGIPNAAPAPSHLLTLRLACRGQRGQLGASQGLGKR